MKKITLLAALFMAVLTYGQDMVITGVFDGPITGGTPKVIELYVINDIPDLSIYGVGSPNNGGASGAGDVEFVFPADAATAGEFIYIATEDVNFAAFFGFTPDYMSGVANNNGDDAIELYNNVTDAGGGVFTGTVMDAFGEVGVDGTDEPWEYLDGWAYRNDGTGPDMTFILTDWSYSGINENDDDTTQATATNPWPIGSYVYGTSSCTFGITSFVSTCDNETGGTDTVTVSVSYTGGGTETFTVTADAGTVGGDDPTSVANGTIVITGVDENSTVNLTVMSTNCNISQDIDTPMCEAATNVANIGALRGSTEGSEYTIIGEVLLTYEEDFRNQKYIEDATGAILIDDSAGVITSMYNIGDGLTGVTGTLTSFNGMMEFIPTQDPGAASSTGNTITAQTVSITMLNANPNDYEAEFVKIEGVMIDNSVESTWVTGTVYPMTNADGTFNFRTSFFDADYIGDDVPTQTANVKGIITERNSGDFFITARSSNDISTNLSVGQNNLDAFTIYPNPTTKGYINISSQVAGAKKVVVYNVLGKKVISTNLTGERLDLSGLNSGVYIVNISQGNSSVTKKLVIK